MKPKFRCAVGVHVPYLAILLVVASCATPHPIARSLPAPPSDPEWSAMAKEDAFAGPSTVGRAPVLAELSTPEAKWRRPGGGARVGRGRWSIVEAGVALGDTKLEVDNGGTGETDATLYRIKGEFTGPYAGGGFQIWGSTSDGDLEAANGLGDNAENQSVDTLGLFAHFTGVPWMGERVRIPIRIGPVLDYTRETGDLNGNVGLPVSRESEIEYLLLGGQIEIMPEFEMMLSPTVSLTFYGGGSAGIAASYVFADIDGRSDEDGSGDATMAGFEAGLRVRSGALAASVGYVRRTLEMDAVDSESVGFLGGGSIPGRSVEFDGILLTGSVRW